MSIRPVDFNGIIQRTQDVSAMKQNENNKPVMEQQNIQTQFSKETVRHMQQVTHADDAQNQQKRYDAKEKGSNEYVNQQKQKKKEKKKDGKVIAKSTSGGFDIKI